MNAGFVLMGLNVATAGTFVAVSLFQVWMEHFEGHRAASKYWVHRLVLAFGLVGLAGGADRTCFFELYPAAVFPLFEAVQRSLLFSAFYVLADETYVAVRKANRAHHTSIRQERWRTAALFAVVVACQVTAVALQALLRLQVFGAVGDAGVAIGAFIVITARRNTRALMRAYARITRSMLDSRAYRGNRGSRLTGSPRSINTAGSIASRAFIPRNVSTPLNRVLSTGQPQNGLNSTRPDGDRPVTPDDPSLDSKRHMAAALTTVSALTASNSACGVVAVPVDGEPINGDHAQNQRQNDADGAQEGAMPPSEGESIVPPRRMSVSASTASLPPSVRRGSITAQTAARLSIVRRGSLSIESRRRVNVTRNTLRKLQRVQRLYMWSVPLLCAAASALVVERAVNSERPLTCNALRARTAATQVSDFLTATACACLCYVVWIPLRTRISASALARQQSAGSIFVRSRNGTVSRAVRAGVPVASRVTPTPGLVGSRTNYGSGGRGDPSGVRPSPSSAAGQPTTPSWRTARISSF